MNILILDDDPIRHEMFKNVIKDHNLTHVYTSKECIEYLDNHTWDMVCLDHDLGGNIYVDSGENTGWEVAKWLEQNPEKQPPKMYIHSFNPVGANNMHQCIPSAVVKPVTILVQEMDDVINS